MEYKRVVGKMGKYKYTYDSLGIQVCNICKERFNKPPYARWETCLDCYLNTKKRVSTSDIDKERISDMIYLYRNGFKLKDIAKKFNICIERVRQLIMRGIGMRIMGLDEYYLIGRKNKNSAIKYADKYNHKKIFKKPHHAQRNTFTNCCLKTKEDVGMKKCEECQRLQKEYKRILFCEKHINQVSDRDKELLSMISVLKVVRVAEKLGITNQRVCAVKKRYEDNGLILPGFYDNIILKRKQEAMKVAVLDNPFHIKHNEKILLKHNGI